jgi:hypothetical protein
MRTGTRFAVAALALVAAAAARPAAAMESCSGTYSATLIQPLPNPLVVALIVYDDSPRNLALAAQFKAGMQSAGVAVSGTPTVRLSLTVALNGGTDDAAPVPSSDNSFSWMSGGIRPQAPDQTQFGRASQDTPPVTVQLRADVRPESGGPVAWVATLRCAMQGNDEQRLAYDIGVVIGRAIGRRADQVPL